MKDLIERQAAIDALMEKEKRLRNINWYDNPYAEGECGGIDEALSIISNLPSAQPDGEYISRQAVTESDLIDWYINSVDESEPVWTEEHIYELFNDFYLIPKED